MAVHLMEDKVVVFKFHQTGIVALCDEVVDFIKRGYDVIYNLDVDKAYFQSDEETLMVVFPEKK